MCEMPSSSEKQLVKANAGAGSKTPMGTRTLK